MSIPLTSVVIQAGGQSSRMGRDKALVELAGKPLIMHVIERVLPLADELLITTNNQAELVQFGYRMASDREAGAGALPGLQTALGAARGEFVLLVACDMPFVKTELLQYLLEQRQDVDVVVPRWDDRLQPLCALYRRKICLAAVDRALAAGKRRMVGWFGDVRVRVVEGEEFGRIDPQGHTFFNINTPVELQAAERLFCGD